jgi:hypothetical protein
MRYWWVNQNQTYRHEVSGDYLWSPKRKKDGHRNPFYEFMREVSPGDLVFSFADTWIRTYGIAHSYAYEAPKPEEFGGAGRNWSDIGWRLDVQFREADKGFRPVDWIERLRPLLPERYAPLRANGHGVQSIYLCEIPEPLALTLAELLSVEALAWARSEVVDKLILAPTAEMVLWEEHLVKGIEANATVQPTEKEALILARRGQGLFRRRVAEVESRCRVTGVDRPEHLRASHCKPWRDSSNDERLDGDNGLLLTPSICSIAALSRSRMVVGCWCRPLRTGRRCSAWGSRWSVTWTSAASGVRRLGSSSSTATRYSCGRGWRSSGNPTCMRIGRDARTITFQALPASFGPTSSCSPASRGAKTNRSCRVSLPPSCR